MSRFRPRRRFLAIGVVAAIAAIAVVVAAQAGTISVTPSPSSLSFGDQPVGTSSSDKTVTYTNSDSSTSVTFGSASLTGSSPGSFSVSSDSCSGKSLAANGSCQIKVKFSPTSSGSKSATLRLYKQTDGQDIDVPLSGTGTSAAVNVSSASISFGNQDVGTTSSARTLTVSSSGSGTVSFTTVSIGGSEPGDFAIASDHCGNSSVGAGSSCSITVTFKPTTTGARSATLDIAYNGSGSPKHIDLTGTGTPPGTTPSGRRTLGQLPPPVLGQMVNVAPVSGTVLVHQPAGQTRAARTAAYVRGVGSFAPLTEADQIRVGSYLDTRHGMVKLVSATGSGRATQRGDFSRGIFKVTQRRTRGGLTILRLAGSSFGRCTRARGTQAVASRRVSKRVIRALRAKVKGRFGTRGRYSAAIVRGTEWGTRDRCDGTLTIVRAGVVSVRDLVRKRTVIVRAGRQYLARAHR